MILKIAIRRLTLNKNFENFGILLALLLHPLPLQHRMQKYSCFDLSHLSKPKPLSTISSLNPQGARPHSLFIVKSPLSGSKKETLRICFSVTTILTIFCDMSYATIVNWWTWQQIRFSTFDVRFTRTLVAS